MKNKPADTCILIVDDEVDIREILQFNLENEGYMVDAAESAEQALEIISPRHSLILLDVMMGGMSGFKMADLLRKNKNNVPIIFLTAKDTENDMLTGFSLGGDDYIAKPFSVKEVIARVKSVLKRTNKTADKAAETKKIWIFNNLTIDLESKRAALQGKNLDLTKTEFNILALFAQHEGRIFSRSDILNKVWDDNGTIVLERTVDVHIARLRKKLGLCGDYIMNRTGYGYTFNANQ